MRDRLRVAGDAALSLRPLVATARYATRRRLRILGYHGVEDPEAFDRQMAHVRERYNPVTAEDVVAAIGGDHRLPDFALWVTFDDGLPSVMRNALPVLETRHIHATMFVCPGVVDTSEPLWWQLVEICVRHGIRPEFAHDIDLPRLIQHLKSLQNEALVIEVERLSDAYRRELGRAPEQSQLSTADLRRLIGLGHSVGNHTWTHPLLDRCTKSEQRTQIVRAHEWLERELGGKSTLFAYPNGNHTRTAENCLEDLGYSLGVLFDHRLTSSRSAPLRASRLRTSDGNSNDRFSAILAGSHPLVSASRLLPRRLIRR